MTQEPPEARQEAPGGLRVALGREVREALLDLDMTQAELARLLGVSQKHMSELINGHSGSPEIFDLIAAVLGYTWKVRLQ